MGGRSKRRTKAPFTAVSLFSGCGGLDLGMTRAGFRVLLANDLDRYCAESFAANFPEVPFYQGNVRDLNPLLMAEVSHGATQDGVDVVFGGPPCPPFSKSRFYRKDKPRALGDPLGFETITGFMEVVENLDPKAFLMENVPGFAYKIHADALEYVEGWAKRLGYHTTRAVVDAANYGVPQHRQRFFLVGVKSGSFSFPPATHSDPSELDLFSANLLPWRTAGEAIGDLDDEQLASLPGHFAGGAVNHLLQQIPPGDNYLYFTKERGYPTPLFRWRSRYWSYLLKLSPGQPSWTIQARRSNNMGPFHWRSRILRIEEVLRLQSFPDNWRLSGTIERQWRQIGNAVPPRLAEALGAQLIRHLANADSERAGKRNR